jgi:hypothetical protein
MGGLLAGWSVNLPMLSMFRKKKPRTGGLIPRKETSQAEASETGMAFEFHPTPDHPLVIRPKEEARKTGLLYQSLPALGAQRASALLRWADKIHRPKLVPAPSRDFFIG